MIVKNLKENEDGTSKLEVEFSWEEIEVLLNVTIVNALERYLQEDDSTD